MMKPDQIRGHKNGETKTCSTNAQERPEDLTGGDFEAQRGLRKDAKG